MADFINENVVKGKWNEFKGEVQKAWGRLTEDEVESSKGDLTALAGLVQRKYGLAQEEVRTRMNEMISRFGPKDEISNDAVRH